MRTAIAGLKMLGLILNSLAVIPFQLIVLLFAKGKTSYFIPQLWHKINTVILGLRVEVIGQPASSKQTFFVGNHLSHFDIFVLGSIIRASFVAKDDLARSPVIAFLCRLQQTAFISRSSGQAAKVQNNIESMINQGKSIILFPEGTSTRGQSVLDFKSTLFTLPLQYADRGLSIQPFTILLLSVNGKSANTKELQDLYAWDRDNTIEMGSHLWNFMHLKGASLRIVFHDPVQIEPGEDRKTLAKRIQAIVSSPLSSNTGENSPYHA